MKKFLSLLLCMLTLMAIQAQVIQPVTMTPPTGYVDSATVKYVTAKVAGSGQLTISTVLTKVANTGSTVAGYAILQGSVDGTNYFNLPTIKQSSTIALPPSYGIDTFTLANTTTNAYSWLVTGANEYLHPYLYYRIKIVMTTTKVSATGSYILRRED